MQDLVSQLVTALKQQMSELNFNNWIRPVQFVQAAEGLTLSVPNKFIRDWISENYLSMIQEEVARLGGGALSVRFQIEASRSAPAVVPELPVPAAPYRNLEIFNPRYCFENFVTGSANQFAFAAAQAVARIPGQVYNPLLFYGGVGLGKTHLLHAIGQAVSQQQPARKVLYVHAEQFTNELIASLRSERMFEFRKKYRNHCDVLLVDDIQFFSAKERTQEEFLHTFHYLFEARRQIVMTCDRLPKDIAKLSERLRSRLDSGLCADIQTPEAETRRRIVAKKAELDGVALPEEVLDFLARQSFQNVRELEGAYIRLSAFASLSGAAVTLEMARGVLREVFPEQSRPCSVESIQRRVADFYQLKLEDMSSALRKKSVARPRQIAMFLCRKFSQASFPELGKKFGGKDHSTVVHAVRKIGELMAQDAGFKAEVAALERQLGVEI